MATVAKRGHADILTDQPLSSDPVSETMRSRLSQFLARAETALGFARARADPATPDPRSELGRYRAISWARFMIAMLCNATCPGPINVTRHRPSPRIGHS